MTWTTTRDLDAFEAAAGDFLRARPAEHTLLLSVVSSLFTDLANPTSNALYRRLGYRPVEDYLVLTFE
ncbi:GNAT family N-acetyltransferase [Streptomyces lydicus]|uniref:GNAT family N-acetyltransferase n=1 Tax=Streptomyces lydicus TaxID=47763 RepID=UPI0037B34AA4